MNEPVEVFAVKYATMPDRIRAQNLMICDIATAGTAMPMDYYLWFIRTGDETILVDTGAQENVLTRRGRTALADIAGTLTNVGVDPEHIRDVILTHAHYDHAGGTDLFPRAQFHLQRSEWDFVHGPAMTHHLISEPYERADITRLAELREQGRLTLHHGDIDFRPHIELVHLGGHTAGLQIVQVLTARGAMVIASDALHFRENSTAGNPFPIVADVVANLHSHRCCHALASADDLVIPGHDPDIANTYPAHPNSTHVFQLA